MRTIEAAQITAFAQFYFKIAALNLGNKALISFKEMQKRIFRYACILSIFFMCLLVATVQ